MKHWCDPVKMLYDDETVSEINTSDDSLLSKSKQKFTINKNSKTKIYLPKVHFKLAKYSQTADYDVQKINAESDNVSEIKTICDIDDTFYKIIEGRPIRPFNDIKVYMKNIRDIRLNKANTAFIKDQILRIDINITEELKLYNRADTLYHKTKSNFFHFVTESYDEAKKTQDCAEAKSTELSNMIKQLEGLSFEHVKLNNKIESVAAAFGTLFRYGKFLYELSPNLWKAHNDIQNSVDFIKVFEEAVSNPTISIEIYKHFFTNNKRPKICFKKPRTLMRVFEAINRQCLNYMQIQNCSAGILKPVLKARDQLESKMLSEMDEVTELIEYYEEQVKWMEEKEAEYKAKFNKLLFTKFKELYGSYDSTKLFTWVQYIHSQLFDAPIDPKDNIITMTVNIERLFIKLTSGLDNINQKVVRDIGNEIFASDIRMMKRAMKAQRSLKEFYILKKSLITSFEPPRYKQRNRLLLP